MKNECIRVAFKLDSCILTKWFSTLRVLFTMTTGNHLSIIPSQARGFLRVLFTSKFRGINRSFYTYVYIPFPINLREILYRFATLHTVCKHVTYTH